MSKSRLFILKNTSVCEGDDEKQYAAPFVSKIMASKGAIHLAYAFDCNVNVACLISRVRILEQASIDCHISNGQGAHRSIFEG